MEPLLNKLSNSVASNNTDKGNDANFNRSYKRVSQEFKDQVIGIYRSGVYNSVEDCARAYEISSNSLYRWLKRAESSSSPQAISEQQSELARLKKELSKAKMENEILKKAAIYFAKQAQ
jgi:transposase